MVSFTLRPLYSRYIFVRMLSGPHDRYEWGGEEKISRLCRESNPLSPAGGLVTILTELPGCRWKKEGKEIRKQEGKDREGRKDDKESERNFLF
jgi:hypothetical protein